MTDPIDSIPNVELHRVTEGTLSIDDSPVVNLDTANAEKIELVNKGPNTVYFRCDGTTPTAQAAGNADQLASGARVVLDAGDVDDVKFINHTAETSTVFYRLYS